MYCADDLDEQSEHWSDVLSERDWSMLKSLQLCNYGNTQPNVKSLMRPSVDSSTKIGRIWLIYIYVICA